MERKRDENNKNYKDKRNKSYYIAKEESNEESNDHEVRVFYITMKDEYNKDEATTLVSYVNKSDRWIIDSGCSNHMSRDKSKFNFLVHCDGNSIRFGNDAPYIFKGKGSIKLIDKIICDNPYYVEGMNYNFLSVSQMNSVGYKVGFENRKAKIYDANGKLIRSCAQTIGNLFYLNMDDATCIFVQFDDVWLWHKRLCHVIFDNLVSVSKMKRVKVCQN